MAEGVQETKTSAEDLEDLQEKLSDELQPIFDILNKIKTKEEISNFIRDQNSDTIKKLLNFIVIDSPNESTRLLKKLIDLVDNTMRAKPDALSTSIHYGVALEYLVIGPILIFKPEIILNIFKFSDVASTKTDGNEEQQYDKYQWLRIMGVFLTILGCHHFLEARNVDFIGSKKLIKYSAYFRMISSVVFAWLVKQGYAEKPLLIQSFVDFASSLLAFRASADHKSKL